MNKDLSKKYCDEIMRYYSQQKKNTPLSGHPDQAAVPAVSENITVPAETEPFHESAYDIEKRYPDPEISEFSVSPDGSSAYPEKITEEKSQGEYGRLRIEASTGSHSRPVEDALVIITRSGTPKDEIIAVFLTDSSGSTRTLELPAPAEELSESPTDQTVSAVVNIIVYKKGYYETENRNVPVFTGVTSIQPVNMIPLPLSTQERRAVFTESEPNL